jgi:two-component system, chemotaxis family, sensor kinase CheA
MKGTSLASQGQIDLFKQSFREEAREALVDLEAALLELNSDPANRELVDRIFRGLHTLKGSGAMFGFEALAAFTHDLETAFDEVRKDRLQIGTELIDLTLAALDLMPAMLQSNSPDALTAEASARDSLLEKVRNIAGIHNSVPVAESFKPVAVQEQQATGPQLVWHIQFAPGPELLLCGANPLLLFHELRQMGGLSIRASMAAIPPLAEIDPERCYLTWDMVLATTAGFEAIRDVFLFVEDGCELTIEPASTAAPEADRSPDASGRTSDRRPAAPASTAAIAEPRDAQKGRRSYDNSEVASSLRVPAAKLDQFVDLVGELVTVQARLSELAARIDDSEVAEIVEEVERLSAALRESSMSIRMMPIRSTFEKFRRLVHDLARDLGKTVELTFEGADTELDKTVLDQLGDPLMHLIRNSMDHGIEPPEVRVAQGKTPTATIHLSARHSGASVLIGISDDGRGIDSDAVCRRAVERGLVAAGDTLSETEIFALLFQPGFSTANTITDVSGRGVGMDVVRQKVESLRGSIDVASEPGAGTTITLRLPLTMAIIDGLLVAVGDACFVLPLATTLECVELTREDVERAAGKHAAYVRGQIVPYICLREHFHLSGRAPAIEQIMLVETSEGRFGFVVDRVLGDCQTVIKSLGRVFRHVQVVSGATILGNGTVALILDPDRLVQDAIRASTRDGRARSPATLRAPIAQGNPQAPPTFSG